MHVEKFVDGCDVEFLLEGVYCIELPVYIFKSGRVEVDFLHKCA